MTQSEQIAHAMSMQRATVALDVIRLAPVHSDGACESIRELKEAAINTLISFLSEDEE